MAIKIISDPHHSKNSTEMQFVAKQLFTKSDSFNIIYSKLLSICKK